jgi:hypothetical protein
MKKRDFKKELKGFYAQKTGEQVVVNIPTVHFLMVGGSDDPNTSPSFQEAVEALFEVAVEMRSCLPDSTACLVKAMS